MKPIDLATSAELEFKREWKRAHMDDPSTPSILGGVLLLAFVAGVAFVCGLSLGFLANVDAWARVLVR